MSEERVTIEKLLPKLHTLPVLSSVVCALIASIADADVDLTHLVRLIERDQGLVSQTLRLANSPFFGLRGRIGTLRDALTVIGFSSLRSLVLATELRQKLANGRMSAEEIENFWTHAHATALAARALAQANPVLAEQAYLAGLLHDLGKLAYLSLDSDAGRTLSDYCRQQRCGWYRAERELELPPHAELGAALARHWHFPEVLCAAIAGHHPPVTLDQPLALIVHVADALACAMACAEDGTSEIPPLDPQAWRELAANPDHLSRAARAVRKVHKSARPASETDRSTL